MIKFINLLLIVVNYSMDYLVNSFPKDSKVLVRVDFNVPIKNGKIVDDTRILLALPTIRLLLKNNNAVVLISHLGRPAGFDQKLSLKPVKFYLESLPDLKKICVYFAESLEADKLENKKKALRLGEILLVENLRFHEGEKTSSLQFAKALSTQIDFFVNDAFSVCHRNDCSVTLVPSLFKNKKTAGLLLQKELFEINKVINAQTKKKLAIIGGAKIGTKITLINNLLNSCDDIIIGGAMAFTFIKYLKGSIGLSLHEPNLFDEIESILINSKKNNCNIHLPLDSVTIKKNIEENIYYRDINKIPDDELGVDIGPKSCGFFKQIIIKSKVIIWNGPMGIFEHQNFKIGTEKIMQYITLATKLGSYSIVGGGDTLASIDNLKKTTDSLNAKPYKFNFMSSGGGAMLAFLQNQDLPGIKSLNNE